MCTFRKDFLPLVEIPVDFYFCIRQVKCAHISHAFKPGLLLFGDVVFVVEVVENACVTCLEGIVFLFEVVKDVADAESRTGSLVAVSRSDALASGTYFVLAFECLVCAVQGTVGREDEVSAFADMQTALHLVTGILQFFCL